MQRIMETIHDAAVHVFREYRFTHIEPWGMLFDQWSGTYKLILIFLNKIHLPSQWKICIYDTCIQNGDGKG